MVVSYIIRVAVQSANILRPFARHCGLKSAHLTFLALVMVSCVTSPETPPPDRYEFHQTEMGVPFRIVLYAPTPNSAQGAAAAAFERVKQLNDCMTDYDSDSELSRLSQTAGIKPCLLVRTFGSC